MADTHQIKLNTDLVFFKVNSNSLVKIIDIFKIKFNLQTEEIAIYCNKQWGKYLIFFFIRFIELAEMLNWKIIFNSEPEFNSKDKFIELLINDLITAPETIIDFEITIKVDLNSIIEFNNYKFFFAFPN